MGEQAYLESFFVENFGDKFQQLKEAVGEAIRQIYGNIYTGYLGVDMLVYRRKTNGEFAIHPCIEVNMRYTMGMVALRISQKYLAPNARGDMRITYTNKPGEAYEQHCFMKKAYPLEMKDGKIKKDIFLSAQSQERLSTGLIFWFSDIKTIHARKSDLFWNDRSPRRR
ncbi:MAG: hypothetical protein V8T12_07605 [Parabacteroides johnsonii]